MKNRPLVSIITPTHNHERYIAQCIESALSQTYPDWEQMIVDSGSTDRTSEIIGRYSDRRIRHIRQDDIGIWNLSKTYNRALDMSRGELVAILEGDDYWPPNKLQEQVSTFARPDVVLSWGRVCQVNDEGKTLWVGPKNMKWFRRHTKQEEVLRKLLFHNFIPCCTVMCRRDALISLGGFRQADYTPYVDYPTWLEMSLLGSFAVVDDVVGYWRSHSGQMTASAADAMFAGNRYAIDFYNRMPSDVARLVGINLDALSANQSRQVTWGSFNHGRVALVKSDWSEAERSFAKVLREGSPLQRAGALLGLACRYLRVDAEWAAGLAGQPRFR